MMDGVLNLELDAILPRIHSDLISLQDARLLITGGTGFLGPWLVELLGYADTHLRLNLTMTLLTRNPIKFRSFYPQLANLPSVKIMNGDVRRSDLPAGDFSHVIHAAAETGFSADSDRKSSIETITAGTSRILEHAANSGASRFLYLSSGAIYGRQPDDLPFIPESFPGGADPLDPQSAYSNAKRLAEQMCAVATATSMIDCVIARCFTFVGPSPSMDFRFAVGDFIQKAVAGRPIVVCGDGTPLRSYLYTRDMAAWLIAILARGAKGTAYNVGSDQPIAIADLADRVAALVEGSGPVRVLGGRGAVEVRHRYVPSISRARCELSLDVWTPLDTAILRSAEFFRKNLRNLDRASS
jgi:nucleoside-diphosphate-sugar epimerase